MERLIFRLFYLLFVEILGKCIIATGALIRWTYLNKDYTLKQVYKLDGNFGVGLIVFVPLISIAIIVYLN